MAEKKSTRKARAGNAQQVEQVANDSELLALADLVEQAVDVRLRVARRLGRNPTDEPLMGSIEERRRAARRTLQRILRALGGHRAEDGAPYLDARMRLTGCILWRASACRGDGTQPDLHMARGVADTISREYPALAARMKEPDRIERILLAIASAAASAKKKPLKLIAATWDGIEAAPRNPVRWGIDWSEYVRNHTQRA